MLNYSRNLNCLANMGDNWQWPLVPPVPGLCCNTTQFQLVTVVAPYIKSANVWYCPTVGPDAVYEGWAASGCWRIIDGKLATMRDQGTTYTYNYNAPKRGTGFPATVSTFMGNKPVSILLDASRWPMLVDQPYGMGFTGSLADPPSSAAPHSGGVNFAYGDGHVKYHHLEEAEGRENLSYHSGDGLYPDQ